MRELQFAGYREVRTEPTRWMRISGRGAFVVDPLRTTCSACPAVTAMHCTITPVAVTSLPSSVTNYTALRVVVARSWCLGLHRRRRWCSMAASFGAGGK